MGSSELVFEEPVPWEKKENWERDGFLKRFLQPNLLRFLKARPKENNTSKRDQIHPENHKIDTERNPLVSTYATNSNICYSKELFVYI